MRIKSLYLSLLVSMILISCKTKIMPLTYSNDSTKDSITCIYVKDSLIVTIPSNLLCYAYSIEENRINIYNIGNRHSRKDKAQLKYFTPIKYGDYSRFSIKLSNEYFHVISFGGCLVYPLFNKDLPMIYPLLQDTVRSILVGSWKIVDYGRVMLDKSCDVQTLYTYNDGTWQLYGDKGMIDFGIYRDEWFDKTFYSHNDKGRICYFVDTLYNSSSPKTELLSFLDYSDFKYRYKSAYPEDKLLTCFYSYKSGCCPVRFFIHVISREKIIDLVYEGHPILWRKQQPTTVKFLPPASYIVGGKERKFENLRNKSYYVEIY